MVALKVGVYGAIGSTPDVWLVKGVIDGGKNTVPQMLAYLSYYHRERIKISVRGNILKARWIDAGLYLGLAGPFVFLLLFSVI